MTHEDENAFIDAIRQFGPLTITHSSFANKSRMEVTLLQPIGVVSADSNLVLVNSRDSSGIMTEHFPTTGIHCVDLMESEVVQFNRSRLINSWLASGRLWYEEDASNHKKSKAFLTWAKTLFEWIRTNYTRNVDGEFIGQNAFDLAKSGRLQLGPPTTRPFSIEDQKRILGI